MKNFLVKRSYIVVAIGLSFSFVPGMSCHEKAGQDNIVQLSGSELQNS